jgi:translation initiation factor 4A
MSKVGSLESLPEADDTPHPTTHDEGMHTLGDSSPFTSALVQHSRNRNATPPVSISNTTLRSSSFNMGAPFPSSSPVSSLDSGSQFTSSADFHNNFEAQLKASPFIRDIIDRLQRCEYSTREIQRDLSDMHRKINILVERTLSNVTSFNNSQPEFKDPFAPASSMSTPAVIIPRGSFSANIAPNQSPPTDDITQISQRLNTLTTSVGQLLALQTQQHIQNATTTLLPAQLGRSTPQMQDVAPNQSFPPTIGSNPNILGHGLSSRQDLRPSPRAPNPPMRTWSAGTLDLSMRAENLSSLGRLEPVRDKRRSVAGSMMRRESVGVRASLSLGELSRLTRLIGD